MVVYNIHKFEIIKNTIFLTVKLFVKGVPIKKLMAWYASLSLASTLTWSKGKVS